MTATTRRRWLIAGAAATGLAAGAGWAWRNQRTGVPSGTPATDALWATTLQSVDGRDMPLAAYRGKKLVLNFWATWCPPCIKEMPEFDRFYRTHAASGWTVLGLAVDSNSAVTEYLKRTPVSYPIAMAGLAGPELCRAFGNAQAALPFTVLINARGEVMKTHLGETRYEEVAGWAGLA